MNIKVTSGNTYNTNFNACKRATIKSLIGGITDAVDIYELNSADDKFLKKLAKNTNFANLLPNMTSAMQKRWQQIFDYCVLMAKENGFKAVISVYKEKICGIMTTCLTDKNYCCVEGISAIPDKKGHKLPYLGQMFFLYLFNNQNSKKIKGYTLDAVLDGPFDVIKKYKNIGFKEGGTIVGKLSDNDSDHIYLQMLCNKYIAQNKCDELKHKFSITQYNENQQTDLLKFID